MTDLLIRPARPQDAPAMARLVDLAGHGLPRYLWSLKRPEAPYEEGERRAAGTEGGFSHVNATIAESDGRTVGLLVDYALPDPYDVGDLREVPPQVAPLIELEAEAPGSWYVNVLATFPDDQGKGAGSALMGEAERRARAAGAPALSLIVHSHNPGAARLYRRLGYANRSGRPLAPWPGGPADAEWILMLKRLA